MKLFAWAIAMVTLTAGVALVEPARAEVVVLQSTTPTLQAGAILKDGDPFEVLAGKSALVMLPNGATRTIAGPFKGKSSDFTKGIAVDRELLGAVRTYVESGGASSGRVGATRSARPAAVVKPNFAGWSVLPIFASGDYCLDATAEPTLSRNNGIGSLVVTVTNLTTSERGQTTFADGSLTAPWPAGVSLANGASFAMAAADLPMRKLQLRLIKPVPQPQETLRVLHGQRCTTQMRDWLAGLMQGAAGR